VEAPKQPVTSVACEGPEDVEDALLEGDRALDRSTARAALRYPVFRRVFLAALVSNIGSWMQTVVLAAFVFKTTSSSTDVSLIVLAQLGPLFVLSLVGGAAADRLDRRRMLIALTIMQGVVSLAIASITSASPPAFWALFVAVLLGGVGQAFFAPTYAALIPTLVEPKDLSGAVSLNSVNMNLSRVIGPAIGGVLYAKVGASWVFVGSAVFYLALIGTLLTVRLPSPVVVGTTRGWRRMLEGFAVARRDHVVGRSLTTLAIFSFFCLPIAVLMPVLAHNDLGIAENTVAYGLLYACFGAGAVVGSLAIGTFLAGQELELLVRFGLAGFAVSLSAFALLRSPGAAYPIVFLVGFCYFASVTSLSTVLQKRLDDSVRGRVMALWVMAFGGTVPLGAIVAGPLSGVFGISAIVLAGAVVAGGLVWFADLRAPVPTEAASAASAP
jgi:predicted MFS family arabinose efflux permease